VPESGQNGVKFVAGRNIPLYAVIAGSKHKLLDLERHLVETGIDYLVAVKSGTRAEIGIFGKGSDMAAEEFERCCRSLGIGYEIDETRAIVGVVGRGIKNMEGVDERLYAALHQCRVNVLSSHDYSDFSTGSIILEADRNSAVGALYNSFF
jgi:aspartokinase